jgi:predicted CoA-binding protein
MPILVRVRIESSSNTLSGSGSSAYAVAGASANTQKFGYRLLAWYNDRSIPVTPITPSSDEILGLRCVKSIDELQGRGKGVSLSVVTPPQATKSILEQAAEQKNLEGIWLQVCRLHFPYGEAEVADLEFAAWRRRWRGPGSHRQQ